MLRGSLAVLFFCSVLFASAFSEERGLIQCDAGITKVPAWTAPGAPYVVEQLDCGETVRIIGLEHGYMQVQIGQKFAYVEAKNVSISQDAEQRLSGLEGEGESTQKISPSISQGDEGGPRRHTAGLNFEVSNIYYEEPQFMRNKGFMYGVSGDYTFRPNTFLLKVDGRFSLGNVDYWSNGTGTMNSIRDYNFETRLSAGCVLKVSERASLTPFAGLGYRYLADLSGGMTSTADARGYDRKSNYLYSPFGMEATLRVKGQWSLGLGGEYDLLWHGWQYSEIGDFILERFVIGLPEFVAKNDQSGGWGARGSIKLARNLSPRLALAIEPYLRYWSIDGSDIFKVLGPRTLYGFQEPANKTTEWGTKFGIRF